MPSYFFNKNINCVGTTFIYCKYSIGSDGMNGGPTEARPTCQARVLCLYYYSNSLGFRFGDEVEGQSDPDTSFHRRYEKPV
jgi:hypothetical protein